MTWCRTSSSPRIPASASCATRPRSAAGSPTIARNRATDHLRQSRDQVDLPDDLPGGDPIEAETFAVLEVVRKLPDAYRETLLMRLVEGMSGNEIAERSGLTPASVRVNLHRGMKMLREKLGWHGNE